MNTEKKMTKMPTIMHPTPHFDRIILHTKNRDRYYLYPISQSIVNKINTAYETEQEADLTLHIGNMVISDSNIILYGAADERSARIDELLSKVIVSKGGSLTVPTPIDIKNKQIGNKLVPGVPAWRVYEYYLQLLGNPANVIIFKYKMPYEEK